MVSIRNSGTVGIVNLGNCRHREFIGKSKDIRD